MKPSTRAVVSYSAAPRRNVRPTRRRLPPFPADIPRPDEPFDRTASERLDLWIAGADAWRLGEPFLLLVRGAK